MEILRTAVKKAIEQDHRTPRQIALDCKMNPKSIYKVINGEQVAGHIYESLVLNLRMKIRPRTPTEKRKLQEKRRKLRKAVEN